MMSTERTTRFTATSALLVAVLSLGLSAWSVGCRNNDAAPERAAVTTRVVAHAGRRAETSTVAPSKDDAPVAVAKSVPAVVPVATSAPVVTRAAVKAREHAPSSTHETDGAFAVKRLVVTRGIDKREPLAADAIHAGAGPLYAFVELANPTDDARTVEVTFKQDGSSREVGHIKLQVPANKTRWRTWGRTALVDKAGSWSAIVRDASGAEIAHTTFQVSD